MIFKGIKTAYRLATVAFVVKKVMDVTDNGKSIAKAYGAYKKTKAVKNKATNLITATKKKIKKII